MRRSMTLQESFRAIHRLASGSAGAQAIQFGSALVLPRLLEPAIFGDFAVFVGYGAVLTAVSGLRLEQAVQLQRDEAKARAFARSALLAGLPIGLGLSWLIVAVAALGWLPGGQGWRIDWIIALPAYTWLGIAFNTATAWHIRKGRFPLVARLRWMIVLGIAVLQIGGAVLGLGLTGQIWGAVLGTLGGFVLAHTGLLRERWKRRGGRSALKLHVVSAATCLAEWRQHGVNLVLASLCSAAAWQIPPVLLREFWGADAAGYYALAFRISVAPLALVQAAISDIAYRETTIRLQNGTGLREYMRRATLALFALSVTIAIAVALAAPWAVPAVLGARWHWVVVLLPWMMLSFVFRSTGGTLSLFTQTGRTRLLLAWHVAFLLAHLACFIGAHVAGLGLLDVTISAALVQSSLYLLFVSANFALASRPAPMARTPI
jgi:O-antigen/teichoic acid export membrane protein